VHDVVLGAWIQRFRSRRADIGMFSVELDCRLDPLAGNVLLVVTGFGFLIHVYATAYMQDEPGGATHGSSAT
jgi:NADH:ubiquinone oxidoreductase subunit 5 (subunit L)/multisubunit Na+/H+ antiporter MnhA subunit